MKKILVSIISLTFLSCSTTEDQRPKEIETKLDKTGKVEDYDYGYNKDGQLILQKESDPGYDLMIAKRVNEALFLELERDAFELDNCIQKHSDPGLEGDGKFKRVDDYESLRPEYESVEQTGVDEQGNLRTIKKTFFLKQIKEAKSQERAIRKSLRFVQKELRKCKTEIKYKKGT